MYCILCAKGHPLVPVFSRRLMRIDESGIYSQQLKQLFANSSNCSNPPTKVVIQTSLSIVNIKGMFLVLVCGLALSLLVFGMELLHSHGLSAKSWSSRYNHGPSA
ncbi:uncharacterized protein [Procambarus clarkii]|uniref:uncharacterized protein n=1 Tax=Procambarus clarkii TaxID=6728 RepID=UPI0037436ADB